MSIRTLFLIILATTGCEGGGLHMLSVDAPDAGLVDVQATDVELAAAEVPRLPPPAPVPPPPAPVLPPPAPIPVPPEGCPCGEELAQSCNEGLCYTFPVCSICRVEPSYGG